ncbi:potassium/proton antiporter [Jeotgalibacillus sp. R-1-5s-1]|uniref:potassium/proton antiporter n=1 Tax=Jeotgalibacillus sp. R-1-5s-1 TaxID=2555897 RepID=UPI00106C3AFB|nr:potassium/proton antiporter [Jeotgalibacillus sp. R-1-5s-1]TFE01176.1 potassium/proton antiporter [Jeotgalibacillus sp. R-1-5s-1]
MDFSVDGLIFLMAAMLIIGVVATKFSSRLGMPSLVLFLMAGMLLSEFIYFENTEFVQLVGILALIVILFEGGTQTQWQSIRPVIGPSASLATLGVLITSGIVGVAAVVILDLSWLEGLLLGAIVGSTDAAAVFSVLGTKNIKERLTSTLEAESGTNDPMAVFLTIMFIELIQFPDTSVFSLFGGFVMQMSIGLVAGLILGRITAVVINKINLDASGLYPVLALSFAIFTYAGTTFINGSGLLAVYVMAVMVGNHDLTYRHSILRFNEGFAWMMQIVMFILLGLLVFPNQLLDVIWQGILLSLILMIIARPVGVFLSMIGMKYSVKEKVFISWAGLKGAVPIVLATYPIVAGIENALLIFNTVFFVVLTSALIQGGTLSWLGNKLGLSGEEVAPSPYSLELVSLGKTESEMVELTIPKDSAVAGYQLVDITLPKHTLITAIIRNQKILTPTGNTRIKEGDTLYVLTRKKTRDLVKVRFYQKRIPPVKPEQELEKSDSGT